MIRPQRAHVQDLPTGREPGRVSMFQLGPRDDRRRAVLTLFGTPELSPKEVLDLTHQVMRALRQIGVGDVTVKFVEFETD